MPIGYNLDTENSLRQSPIIVGRRLALVVVLLVTGCAYFNTFYNARTYYRDGTKLMDANQTTQAKAKFDKAIEKSALVIKRWPKSRWSDDALFLIGMSYYQEGYYSKAMRHFEQVSLVFPHSGLVPDAELYRGLSLLQDKQYGQARLALDGLKQKYPRLADAASFYLAKSLIDREETQQGIDSLTAFVGRHPRSRHEREALRLLADASLRLGKCADAEKWYNQYTRLTSDPKQRAQAKLKVAVCRYEQGKNEEAIEQAKDLLGRYADLDDEANLILGKSLDENGKPTEAIAAWSKVRGASDYGAEANFRIGKYYEEQSQFDKARAYYDTARLRRVDSDHGVLAVKRLSLLDAFTQQKAGKREPAEAMFLLAEVHNLNLGDYDKAMQLYQEVRDSFPQTDWAAKGLFAKAWIIRNVKHDTAGAEPLLREEIAEYPETEYADESRRWLGLPVPKREKKKPEVKAETTRARADTSGLAGQVLPAPAESSRIDTLAGKTAREPEMFPPGMHRPRPDRLRERLGEATGTKGAGPEAGEASSKPDTGKSAAGVDTARKVEPKAVTPIPRTDTLNQVRPGAGVRESAKTAAAEAGAKKPESAREATPEPTPSPSFARVHFRTDSADLGLSETDSLELNVRLLKENPDVQVTVYGYCDPRAGEAYNIALGMRRAQAVRGYLVKAGIAEARIAVRSRGKENLVSTKPEEYWLDRRVELQVR